jgi:hypothetical protein
MTTVEINLPSLHAAQSAISESTAKRKIVCAGRRGGKTTLAAIESVERLFAGERVLLCSATQDQADAFWHKVVEWCSDAIASRVVKRNESRRILSCEASGGRVRVKTASNPDALRGDFADFLVLDECALLPDDIWEAVGPMLIDSDGTAYMLSSPRPRGAFRDLYTKAQQDTSGRWAAFHFTTYDNPNLKTQAIDDLAGDLTESARRQELEAEFLDSESTVFRNFDACLTAPRDTIPSHHDKHRIVAGLDWGQSIDYTVISVFCCDCRAEVALDRFIKLPWQQQRDRIKTLVDLWSADLLAEYNSIGSPNVEALIAAGCRVQAFITSGQTKPALIQSLALCFEREEARWLDDKWARSELDSFEVTISAATNRPQYHAAQGCHDDSVIARALAWRMTVIAPVRRV